MPIYNAADDIIRAFQAGRQMKQTREAEARAVEDRQIEKDLLKHRLAQMATEQKFQTWQRSRAAQLQNVDLLSGQPESQVPPAQLEGMPSQDLSQAIAGYPGQPSESVPVQANQPRSMAPVTIPGFPDMGIADVPVRPQTLEQQIAARIADARLKTQATPQRPVSVPAGGTLIDPRTGQIIARGQPKPTGLTPAQAAADSRARDRDRRAEDRDAAKTRADAEKVKRLAGARKNVALATLEKEARTVRSIGAERLPPMSQEQIDAEKLRIENAYLEEIGEPAVSTLGAEWRGGAKPAPAKAGPVIVTLPNGTTATFPTQWQADAFKREAGIK